KRLREEAKQAEAQAGTLAQQAAAAPVVAAPVAAPAPAPAPAPEVTQGDQREQRNLRAAAGQQRSKTPRPLRKERGRIDKKRPS
ncbi:hypothetical protein, partial [Staphylococcus aureus]|uniref:hypothetical protein n=1 Tax=Staphylococcus aureus TaxID=1280 RepID=UPI001C52FA19